MSKPGLKNYLFLLKFQLLLQLKNFQLQLFKFK